ncbi:LacI family DNA-binding transcriptional regulator [Massilia terrae]|uniref:LacI family DNA-binding transcriptional regulator n=1 Tax=Massilia terrae TaxID=1811224 RepID=A0ABT2D521_9BURK|nr:LacI family DNA-binding transcriptional regulator [Massilia terrae]MCS0661189.1 LacI family DNA-binding transcriptional regulator [Massilia terrae]
MSDIARLAGVSVSAVSRALRGSPEIGDETRKRIVELAHSLNYTVNVGAQNLRLRQNTTVAVIVPSLSNLRQRLTEPFFISLISAIANALTDRGFEMLLTRVEATRTNFADAYFTGRAAGLIFTGQWLGHDQLNELALSKVPFVVWGEQREQQVYCTVGTDNLQGGRIATEHLLEQGARNVAIIGDFNTLELKNRYEGYLLAHRERGLEPAADLLMQTSFDTEAIERSTEALLARNKPVDGIFACSDLTAMTVINTLIHHGKRVPEDIAVSGYDDIELASYFRPSLTTVRQPMEAAADAIVEALIEQMKGERPASRRLVTELVKRESTAPAQMKPRS